MSFHFIFVTNFICDKNLLYGSYNNLINYIALLCCSGSKLLKLKCFMCASLNVRLHSFSFALLIVCFKIYRSGCYSYCCHGNVSLASLVSDNERHRLQQNMQKITEVSVVLWLPW